MPLSDRDDRRHLLQLLAAVLFPWLCLAALGGCGVVLFRVAERLG